MRFQINLDCTPEEARQFFGMPDIVPLQQAMMEELSKRMSEGIHTMEPETLMKTWVPAIFQGWSQMQQSWWSQMTKAGRATVGPDQESEEGDLAEPQKNRKK